MAKIFDGNTLYGEFALKEGVNSQSVTLMIKREGETHIEEMITFVVVGGRLAYNSQNNKPLVTEDQ